MEAESPKAVEANFWHSNEGDMLYISLNLISLASTWNCMNDLTIALSQTYMNNKIFTNRRVKKYTGVDGYLQASGIDWGGDR